MKVGDETTFHGARAVIYQIDGEPNPAMYVTLLEDIPCTAKTAQARILLTRALDPLAPVAGQEGDCFKVMLPPKGYTDKEGTTWDVDWKEKAPEFPGTSEENDDPPKYGG